MPKVDAKEMLCKILKTLKITVDFQIFDKEFSVCKIILIGYARTVSRQYESNIRDFICMLRLLYSSSLL